MSTKVLHVLITKLFNKWHLYAGFSEVDRKLLVNQGNQQKLTDNKVLNVIGSSGKLCMLNNH